MTKFRVHAQRMPPLGHCLIPPPERIEQATQSKLGVDQLSLRGTELVGRFLGRGGSG